MNAMTWWDHETSSIWSQPWGLAINGSLKGTRLEAIPAGVVPWSTWLMDHPDSLVLRLAGRGFDVPRERFRENYVIGVALGDHAKAYPFRPASLEGVINDQIGTFPVVVLADPETKAVNVYLRRAGDRVLDFSLVDGRLVDIQTGTTWDRTRGTGLEGPLLGELLRQVPYNTSYDWAWEDFYPHSEFYR